MSTDRVQPDHNADEDVIQSIVAHVNSLENRVEDRQAQATKTLTRSPQRSWTASSPN